MNKLLIVAAVLGVALIGAYSIGYRVLDTSSGYLVLNPTENCVYEALMHSIVSISDEPNPYLSIVEGEIAIMAKQVTAYQEAGVFESAGGLLMGADNLASHCFR